ncbi:formyl transferase [Pseudoalteromonas luteoviolacea]|uniref:formyl transferase n=1 Tax=Pseudoalteromonas luteoviolacea TaxID=43657 RepID=UPI00068EA261|nr:formyltransferase family protein [Pseudoalteromonas luteoviolacea]
MAKILVLGSDSLTTKMLNATLLDAGHQVEWLEEKRDDKVNMLKRRAKKQGLIKVASQIAFMILMRLFSGKSSGRIKELTADMTNLDQVAPYLTVPNVNEDDVISHVKDRDADLVILCGTRILSKAFIQSIEKTIVNIHLGLTPKYRGVHGGYWALVNKDKQHFGATIHLVDEGIDTGGILKQACFEPSKNDWFLTYPIVQQKEILKFLPAVLEQLLAGDKSTQSNRLESAIWSHPTLFKYLWHYFVNGVR